MAVVLITGMVMISACTSTTNENQTANTTPTFNESYNNQTETMKSGETFKVVLDENPTTGYSWNVSVTGGLTVLNDTYLAPNTTLVGAGGQHEWLVEATGTGDQQFSGIYKRPWEPVFGNETTFTLNITIT
jgi:inhibitor of cysteine peptidase